jgi:hypothetical protein
MIVPGTRRLFVCRLNESAMIRHDPIRMNVLLSALVALLFAGCRQAPESFDKIDLRSVHATFEGNGVTHFVFGEDFPFEEDLRHFRRLLPVASNIFLVAAENENDAWHAAIRFKGSDPCILPKADEPKQIWLAAYFGFAPSDPTRFTIDSLETNRSKLRLTYSVPARIDVSSADTRPYLAIAPIKGLQPGPYTLELRQSRTGDVTLMRRIRLVSPND